MKALSNTVNEESPLHHEYICESAVQPMTFQGKEYQTEVSILFSYIKVFKAGDFRVISQSKSNGIQGTKQGN